MKLKFALFENIRITQILEQAIISLGNFLFIFLGAKLLDINGIGEIATIWAVAQLPVFFCFSLILYPISSSKDQYITRSLVVGHSVCLYVILITCFIIIAPLLLHFLLKGQLHSQHIIVTILWSALNLAFDITRWLLIRYSSQDGLKRSSLLRWIIFFSSAAIFQYLYELEALSYIILNISCLLLWFILNKPLIINSQIFSEITIKPVQRQFKGTLYLFINAVTNSSLNYLIAFIITNWFSLELLAAYQLFRSIGNTLGVLSQYVDNHFTASLSRSNKRLVLRPSYYVLVCFLISIFYFVLDMLSGPITKAVLAEYAQYHELLPPLIMAGLIQVFSRPAFTSIRIDNQLFLLVYYALYMYVLIFPAIVALAYTNQLVIILWLLASAPLGILGAKIAYDIITNRVSHKTEL